MSFDTDEPSALSPTATEQPSATSSDTDGRSSWQILEGASQDGGSKGGSAAGGQQGSSTSNIVDQLSQGSQGFSQLGTELSGELGGESGGKLGATPSMGELSAQLVCGEDVGPHPEGAAGVGQSALLHGGDVASGQRHNTASGLGANPFEMIQRQVGKQGLVPTAEPGTGAQPGRNTGSGSAVIPFESMQGQTGRAGLAPVTQNRADVPIEQQQNTGNSSAVNPFESMQGQAGRAGLAPVTQNRADIPNEQQQNTGNGSPTNVFESMQGQAGRAGLAPMQNAAGVSNKGQHGTTNQSGINLVSRAPGKAGWFGPTSAQTETNATSVQQQNSGGNALQYNGATVTTSSAAGEATSAAAVASADSAQLGGAGQDGAGPSGRRQQQDGGSSGASLPSHKKLQRIKRSDLAYLYDIGAGAFGTVRLARWQGCWVAVKHPILEMHSSGRLDSIMREESIKPSRGEVQILAEVERLAEVEHVNTMRFLGVVEPDHERGLEVVTQFYHGGSLRGLIEEADTDFVTISWHDRVQILQGIAAGMGYLHTLPTPIVHGDLRTPNILLTQSKPPFKSEVVKIADFGSSRILQADKSRISFCTSQMLNPCASAPEKIWQNKDSPAADVYSFAIIMWELLTFKVPFHDYNLYYVPIALANGKRPVLPEDEKALPAPPPPGYINLIKGCWDQDPKKRPSFEQVLKQLDQMFKQLDQMLPQANGPAAPLPAANPALTGAANVGSSAATTSAATPAVSPLPASGVSAAGTVSLDVAREAAGPSRSQQPVPRAAAVQVPGTGGDECVFDVISASPKTWWERTFPSQRSVKWSDFFVEAADLWPAAFRDTPNKHAFKQSICSNTTDGELSKGDFLYLAHSQMLARDYLQYLGSVRWTKWYNSGQNQGEFSDPMVASPGRYIAAWRVGYDHVHMVVSGESRGQVQTLTLLQGRDNEGTWLPAVSCNRADVVREHESETGYPVVHGRGSGWFVNFLALGDEEHDLEFSVSGADAGFQDGGAKVVGYQLRVAGGIMDSVRFMFCKFG